MARPRLDSRELAEHLFREHRTALRWYLRRLTGREDIADDLTQEVYVRVVRGADRYTPCERERAWVFRIARNIFVDYLRRERRRAPTAEGDPNTCDPLPPSQSVRLELQEALERLDSVDRDAFLLAEIAGLQYDEIGTLLGLSVPAVRSRIYRARLGLRADLTPPTAVRPTSAKQEFPR